jgi:hypothetical protein
MAALASAGPAYSQGGELSLQMHLVQAGGAESVQITVAPTIVAGPASKAPLAIRIGSLDALPKNSSLRVRGLPPTVSLSEGYVTAPGAWSVPIHALPTLQMSVPTGVTGRAELNISLVTEDGALLAQARTILVVQPPQERLPHRPERSVRSHRKPSRRPCHGHPSCLPRTARRATV